MMELKIGSKPTFCTSKTQTSHFILIDVDLGLWGIEIRSNPGNELLETMNERILLDDGEKE